ncbi:hypothetical protein E0E62_19530 [Streptomyces sp. 16-176A]
MVHWLMWPLMHRSTDPDHNLVHVQLHEQMHVHAECLGGYSFDEPFTEAVSCACPRTRRPYLCE